jgi:hypothetical protein
MAVLPTIRRASHPGFSALLVSLCLALLCARVPAARGATTGKLQGRIVAADTGEPVGFVDLLLQPADTTIKRVGGMSNADGTFLLEAAPGRYALQVRAMSYAHKRIEGVLIEAGKLQPLSIALASRAIQQKEIVVEARARTNTESSLLTARRRAAAVGDAVSAEQVRKTPDKDAAEVLRRVTGLSVSDGKYVFVRGLGERYSSTEIDGVRVASPEQNKRVVPLDLLPANLLENIVVQKTYTADRSGEFGGGDVQVRTRDFPGNRTWSVSASQTFVDGVTFHDHQTYAAGAGNFFGFGADARQIPQAVFDLAGGRPLFRSDRDPSRGFTVGQLRGVAKAFSDVWSAKSGRSLPNGSYSATYGDERRVFGRSLGVIESWTFSHGYDRRDESQRFFADRSDTSYDYAVKRWTETTRLGGITGLGYRLSPRHSLSLRGLFTQDADNEVRTYEGVDHNQIDTWTGTWLQHRVTRLMYVERSVLSGSAEGKHQFAALRGLDLDWKLTRSRASRLQPDRRETRYDRRFLPNGDAGEWHWLFGSTGSREYGDLRDNGWGQTLSGVLPLDLGKHANGKLAFGYDRQTKSRDNFYRRFDFIADPSNFAVPRESPPESIFQASAFDPKKGYAIINETTLDIDNYTAEQRVSAGYLMLNLPIGSRVRGNFGVRREQGFQDVRSFDLFHPSRITKEGKLDNADWLPSANLTVSVGANANLRFGASRTLSRPDLNELSPSPALDYVGGMRVAGNPDLRRALIDNYDFRIEAFPTLSEVFAVGVYYKNLHEPIEQVITGDSPPDLVPMNADRGHNVGTELELRSGLGRFSRRLSRLSLNSNASIISSHVTLKPRITRLGSTDHPLMGQANYIVNVALSYTAPRKNLDASLLVGALGKRLRVLAEYPKPDIYEQPSTTLDAALNWAPSSWGRFKFAGKSLLDPLIRQLQSGKEVTGYHQGRSFSVAFSLGS